ncbi:MAG: hypothetical protein HYX32_02155 [Actinobacteria bacterium]|nr:hypothetical protein [Actinomycetota bacterium]
MPRATAGAEGTPPASDAAPADSGRPARAATAPPLNIGRRLLQPTAAGTLGLAFALWGFWLGVRPLGDNSFFTHLATGRVILDAGAVPNADPYSFTAAGEPWVVQSWLASLLYGMVDSWFGAAGLRMLMGVLTGVLAWLAWRLTKPANLLVRVASTALVVTIGGVMWSPRPLLVGLIFMAVTLLVAEGETDPRWLAPIFWIWVNSHGSFPLGLVALVVLFWGRRLDKQDPSIELRGLKWAALGTVLAAVNPLGPKILIFPVELLRRSDSLQQIIEWKSPDFTQAWSKLFLAQMLVVVLALVRRPQWRGALMVIVFVAASLLGQRNVAVASLVFALVMAQGLAGVGGLTGKDRSVVFAVAGAVGVVMTTIAPVATFGRSHYDLSTFPVDAVAWLDERDAIGRPSASVAVQDTTGNYLELLYGPDARAFIDDRIDMYPKPVVDDLLNLLRGSTGWRQVLDDRQVNVVLWERGGPTGELLTQAPDWRIVYEDNQFFVACRRGTGSGRLTC